MVALAFALLLLVSAVYFLYRMTRPDKKEVKKKTYYPGTTIEVPEYDETFPEWVRKVADISRENEIIVTQGMISFLRRMFDNGCSPEHAARELKEDSINEKKVNDEKKL